MARLRSVLRWVLTTSVVCCVGCAHERMAREHLEEGGCTIVSLTKKGKAFDYETRCGSSQCTGTIEVRGTRWRNEIDDSSTCFR